jgi:hypothetical protein
MPSPGEWISLRNSSRWAKQAAENSVGESISQQQGLKSEQTVGAWADPGLIQISKLALALRAWQVRRLALSEI